MTGDAAADLSFEEISTGQEFTGQYTIDENVVSAFIACSGDRSPLHVDNEYARSRGFSGRVTHGTILNAFVSHLVGMRAPGRRALLQSVDLRYLQPCHIGDRIRLRAVVVQKSDAVRTIVLNVELENETRGTPAGRGRVQVGVAE